ncbi:MAG: hypothetical protein J0I06_08750 [Planctomycetes bacterium]|nr:hypothetical protein [Planctomycetota bacterium]
MNRFGRVIVLIALACWPAHATAGESRLGLVVGQTKDGAQVSTVADGSAAKFMGFKKDDRIYRIEVDGKERNVRSPKDLDELLNCKEGRYKIYINRNGTNLEKPITGALKNERGVPYFIPER